MSEVLLQHQIDLLLDAVDGELTSKSRVIDGLLDLRLAAGERTDVVDHLDALFGEIPGRTTVTNAWWMGELESIRRLVAAEAALN